MEYTKIVNGVRIPLTPEEVEEVKRRQREEESLPKPAPSLEERVTQLEAEQADMIAAYEEGVNNG